MSELYDRVVLALRETAHDKGHKWLRMHPSTWAEIQSEIMPAVDEILSPVEVLEHGLKIETTVSVNTPGTWLLGVDIMLDLKIPRGELIIRIEKEF